MGALIHSILNTALGHRLREGGPVDPVELAQVGAFAARVDAITVARPGANPPWLPELS